LRVHERTEDSSIARGAPPSSWLLLVELVGGPRRSRALLVQRLPVADAAPQELGPGGAASTPCSRSWRGRRSVDAASD